jgi:acetyltransferase-like isoleucine patch superfamily enzyme
MHIRPLRLFAVDAKTHLKDTLHQRVVGQAYRAIRRISRDKPHTAFARLEYFEGRLSVHESANNLVLPRFKISSQNSNVTIKDTGVLHTVANNM